MTTFTDRFDGLDESVWTPAYLPAWSSRAAAAATWSTGDGGPTLSIPDAQPRWCPDLHPGPLRVSAVQSANRSGPVGSTDAPQPFLDGQTVREAQQTVLGFVPHFGRIAVTMSAELGPRSMCSAWMVRLEDEPDRCGELCLMEVFGDAIEHGDIENGAVEPGSIETGASTSGGAAGSGVTAAVGQGVHAFRDPALREEFAAPRRAIDVSRPHRYEVEWRAGRVAFGIDGEVTRVSEQAPDYPMLLILGVFDFPDRPGAPSVPRLRVHSVEASGCARDSLVRGRRLGG